MAIAYQPATAPDPVSARPSPASYEYYETEVPPIGHTVAKLAGLIVATALGVALATAIVGGTALFVLLNVAGR